VSGYPQLALKIRGREGTKVVQMTGNFDEEILEVCPAAGDKIVVFASAAGVALDLYIINRLDGAVLDIRIADTAAVAPDGNWLAYRAHPVPGAEVSQSEEYLVYDLSKNASENPGMPCTSSLTICAHEPKGRVMYPTVLGHTPLDSFGLPENQVHAFRSESFFWAVDSKSLVFADGVQKRLALVWVRLQGGEPVAYIHAILDQDVCEGWHHGNLSPGLTLSSATIEGRRTQAIVAQFRALNESCTPKLLNLHEEDFIKADIEQHPIPPARKPSVPIRK